MSDTGLVFYLLMECFQIIAPFLLNGCRTASRAILLSESTASWSKIEWLIGVAAMRVSIHTRYKAKALRVILLRPIPAPPLHRSQLSLPLAASC